MCGAYVEPKHLFVKGRKKYGYIHELGPFEAEFLSSPGKSVWLA